MVVGSNSITDAYVLKKFATDSGSFKVIQNYTSQYGVCKFLLVIHCGPKYVSIL